MSRKAVKIAVLTDDQLWSPCRTENEAKALLVLILLEVDQDREAVARDYEIDDAPLARCFDGRLLVRCIGSGEYTVARTVLGRDRTVRGDRDLLCRARQSCHPAATLRGYLRSILRSEAKKLKRAGWSKVILLGDREHAATQAQRDPNAALLPDLLGKLNGDDQVIARLCAEGCSQAAIAAAVGMSRDRVQTRITAIRTKLTDE